MSKALPRTIPHLVEAAALQRGEAIAIVDRGDRWSYSRLWSECRAAASSLAKRGITGGDRVAIWAPNSREWIAAAVGAMACGAAIVPLNTRLKGVEASDILRRTKASMVFITDGFLGIDYSAQLAQQSLPSLRDVFCLARDWEHFLAGGSGKDDPQVDAALAGVHAEMVSDIMFTSGTTGRPKGVMSLHGRIVPMVERWAETVGLCEGDRYLVINPFFHSFGYKAGWVAAIMRGAVIYPLATFDISAAIELIEKEQISFLPGPPTIYQALMAAKAERDFDASSLRGGVTGAATVPAELVRRIRSELHLSDIVTAYGMTESVFISACRRSDPAELIANSCGKALPGIELRVVDADGLDLPPGDVGEILVRSEGSMAGYLDDAEATREALDGEGWLHTGDIGTLDQAGYLRITDRKKDMYISGGFNVYPAEVENLLCMHPAIAQAAVVGVADGRLGEVGRAFVVPRPDALVDPTSVREWARENMANYKVPQFIEVVEALPLNAAGKVMKEELRR